MTARASRILFGAALTIAATHWTPAAAEPKATPFVELVADGRPVRFDPSCGDAFVEILDPESSSPRLILSATCSGTHFDVVAHPTSLPASMTPDRVRFLDVATGQERIATRARIDVERFGKVGETVAGRVDFSMPGGLNQPALHYAGTFRVERRADRNRP